LELLVLLRQHPHWNAPPIILMSANAGQDGITEALRDGQVAAFLKKPFDVDQLVQEIQTACTK
jgi:CheY-like chemotaxis protein